MRVRQRCIAIGGFKWWLVAEPAAREGQRPARDGEARPSDSHPSCPCCLEGEVQEPFQAGSRGLRRRLLQRTLPTSRGRCIKGCRRARSRRRSQAALCHKGGLVGVLWLGEVGSRGRLKSGNADLLARLTGPSRVSEAALRAETGVAEARTGVKVASVLDEAESQPAESPNNGVRQFADPSQVYLWPRPPGL